jgi:hypothetical protein
MLSGGSTESVSLIWFAITFTVHVVPCGRSDVGSSVIVDPGEPETANACAEEVGHSRVNELVVALTDSLKFTTMFAFNATGDAPLAGAVEVTLGAASATVVVVVVVVVVPVGALKLSPWW